MKEHKFLDFESITAIALSFIGGILDMYCLFNYNIYGMLHTGNFIKMVQYIIDGNIEMFLASFFIILSFAIGIFLANLFEKKSKHNTPKNLLIITIVLLICAMAIPNNHDAGKLSKMKFFGAIIFGFEGAFMLHSFVSFGSYSYSATTMTANINRFVTSLYERIVNKDKTKNYGVLTYLFIFIFFCLGVGISYSYMKYIKVYTTGFLSLYEYNLVLILPLICLVCILIATIKNNKKQAINN